MRGRYRILLGMAAGVGKTYRMLQEGRSAHADGRDVVIGYLEPHDRPETTALAEGLEQIPRLRSSHGGLELEEMDVDAVVRRAPELALIDELAHTNVPEARNEKRWQDIDEVLAAGIDVISTVNIQHLESLNDAIAELTDVRVRETFPDQVLEDADEVVLVDLTPEALQERLRAGKVYSPERAGVALDNFFRTDRLSALRELALREVAEGVGARRQAVVLDPLSAQAVAERVLALVTPEPRSQRILRRAWRSAERLGAPLDALWVRQPRPRAEPGRAGAACGAAPAGRRARRALPRGGGRQPRRHGSAGRRRARLHLCARRDTEREPPPRDPARLARLGPRPRAPRHRHPGDRKSRRSRRAQMIPALIAVIVLAAAAVGALAYRARRPRASYEGKGRILVPFSGALEPTVLNAAIRIAQAQESTLVAAYLLVVPLQYPEEAPRRDQVAVAVPLLEAVELAALRAGVPVDARIEKGRSLTHALRRLWEVESFERIVAPASGFSAKELAWLLTNAPAETIVLRPAPALAA